MKEVALVTGANKGIGKEAARVLAAKGMTVYLGARDDERGTAAEHQLRHGGALVHHAMLDVTRPSTISAVAGRIDARELQDSPIAVNAVSLGYCATDLNSFQGILSAAEGANVVARAATDPDLTPPRSSTRAG